jgi:general nucleoside transport system permease protein
VTELMLKPEATAQRTHLPQWATTAGAPIAGAVLGLGIGAALIWVSGASPVMAYRAMAQGAFGGWRQIQETLLKTTPLLLMGLGLTAAFRARVWNIGGEGQFFMGALFGGSVALLFPGLPRPILLVAMLVAGLAGGALWALLAGWLKVRHGMNEIISTLMLNYIAVFFMQYMARGPLQEPGGYLPQSAQFVEAARFPTIPGSRIHLGVLLAALLIPAVFALLWSTPLGFRLRAVGQRASVARYAGINVERVILFVLAFSGGLAGLAGVIEVATLHTRLRADISGGYGFSGVLVALLGRMHPAGVAVASLFFAALTIGAQSMKVITGLPDALANAIQAIIVLCVLAVDALARRSRD